LKLDLRTVPFAIRCAIFLAAMAALSIGLGVLVWEATPSEALEAFRLRYWLTLWAVAASLYYLGYGILRLFEKRRAPGPPADKVAFERFTETRDPDRSD
jgi:hypothetical protein